MADGHILVVEDDVPLAELLAEVLDLLDQDRDREDTFLRGRPWSWVAAQSG